jgi:hypothetical protein
MTPIFPAQHPRTGAGTDHNQLDRIQLVKSLQANINEFSTTPFYIPRKQRNECNMELQAQ